MNRSRYRLEELPNGDDGTRVTLARMKELANAAVAHPLVRGVAVQIARTVTPRDTSGQIAAIRSYLMQRVQFLHDPITVEWVHDPVRVLESIGAHYYASLDCDDVATLAASLGGAIGIPARFIVLGFFSPEHPMAHVYTELWNGHGWEDVDTTRSVSEVERIRMTARTWVVPVFE